MQPCYLLNTWHSLLSATKTKKWLETDYNQSKLTSWMSSPSRKRTGFRMSRWSIRKVLGSFRARTMHLNREKMFEVLRLDTFVVVRQNETNALCVTCEHQPELGRRCLLCNFPAAPPSLLLQAHCEVRKHNLKMYNVEPNEHRCVLK